MQLQNTILLPVEVANVLQKEKQKNMLNFIINKLIEDEVIVLSINDIREIFLKENDQYSVNENLNYWCDNNFLEARKIDDLSYKISKSEYFRDLVFMESERFTVEELSIFKNAFESASTKTFERSLRLVTVEYFSKGTGKLVVYYRRRFLEVPKTDKYYARFTDQFIPFKIDRIK